MAADAARLRALHGSEYTVEDARRLREIVQHGPAALTAGLARRRIDGAELDNMIGNIVEPSPYLMASTDVGAELDRFLAA